jgi:membrane protein required for colicin V production
LALDFFIVALILVFAIFGAFAGAARQIANLVALVLGYLCARPIGVALGPYFARSAGVPLIVGIAGSTLMVFIVVAIAVRVIARATLRKLLTGPKPEDRALDRTLGFVFAALKVGLTAYVVLCALSFVEDNVAMAGRRIGVSPRDSLFFGLARKYNLFEYKLEGPMNDLLSVLRVASDPKRAARLQDDPSFQNLLKDPRFRRALSDGRVRQASKTGDYRELLKGSGVLELLEDTVVRSRLHQAAAAAESSQ